MAVKDVVAKDWELEVAADGRRYSGPDDTPPLAPANFAAVPSSDTSATVTWDLPVDPDSTVTDVVIFGGAFSGGPYDLLTEEEADELETELEGLPAGRLYLKGLGRNIFDEVTDLEDAIEIFVDITGPGSPGSGTYVTTHHVKPFADVSGASDDEDEQDASAFAAASNATTPCTVGCAKRWASGSNKVEIHPGVYDLEETDSRWVASLAVQGNGTSAEDKLVFFTTHPAAYTVGMPFLLSEFRRPAIPALPGDSIGPIFSFNNGSAGRTNIVLDGVYFDESVCAPGPSEGLVQFHSSTGCEVRRCWFDRDNVSRYTTTTSGYNGNPVYGEIGTNNRVVDCLFDGDNSMDSKRNDACIELYNQINFIIEHCEFYDCGWAVHNKTEAPISQIGIIHAHQNTHIRYCWIDSCCGIDTQTCRSTFIYYCFIRARTTPIVGVAQSLFLFGTTGTTNTPMDCPVQVWNCTIIVDGVGNAVTQQSSVDDTTGTAQFRDNIVLAYGAGTNNLWEYPTASVGSRAPADWDVIDYNQYYDRVGTDRFFAGASNVQFAAWQTYTGAESHSDYSNPVFVDEGNDDFRLAANGQVALTGSSIGGPRGCYITGLEEVGMRETPVY